MKSHRQESFIPRVGVSRHRHGFTLIELLIVVAIIAILAAIALPNFLDAQTRAKVARVKADYRALAAGIEAYFTDYSVYPWRDDPVAFPTGSQYNEISYRLAGLTTPIAYTTSVSMTDPFVDKGAQGNYTDGLVRYQYNFRNHQFVSLSGTTPPQRAAVWVLNSLGPDRVKNQGLNVESLARGITLPVSSLTILYDPTNGTTSAGDMPWTGGQTKYTNR